MAFEFKCPQRGEKRIHARVIPYMSHDKTHHESQSHAPLQAVDTTGEPFRWNRPENLSHQDSKSHLPKNVTGIALPPRGSAATGPV